MSPHALTWFGATAQKLWIVWLKNHAEKARIVALLKSLSIENWWQMIRSRLWLCVELLEVATAYLKRHKSFGTFNYFEEDPCHASHISSIGKAVTCSMNRAHCSAATLKIRVIFWTATISKIVFQHQNSGETRPGVAHVRNTFGVGSKLKYSRWVGKNGRKWVSHQILSTASFCFWISKEAAFWAAHVILIIFNPVKELKKSWSCYKCWNYSWANTHDDVIFTTTHHINHFW